VYLVKRMMHTSYGISLQASTDIRSETNSRLLYASCELYASKVFHTRENQKHAVAAWPSRQREAEPRVTMLVLR